MFSKIKIGDMAKLNQLSIQTLRYYDEKNLLKPIEVDSATGFRYYSIEQSSLLDTIQLLKALHFSLEEIRSFLYDDTNEQSLEQLFTKKQLVMREQIQELTNQMRWINHFQKGKQILESTEGETKIVVTSFACRNFYLYRIPKNVYEMSEGEYEFYLRSFKNQLKEKDFRGIFSCVGTVMNHRDFLNGHFSSKQMFLEKQIIPLEGFQTYEAKNGLYAVMYCKGFKNELTALHYFREALLIDFADDYQVVGDYLCEVVDEFPEQAREGKREMLIRMQVRVEKK